MNETVVWDRNLIADIEESHQCKQICLDAQSSYLKAAATQRTRHQCRLNGFVKEYTVGETVGIKIQNVDRTNTDGRLLPCKVLGADSKEGRPVYKLYCATGILRNSFSGEEMVSMNNVHFPGLTSVDPSNLEEVLIVQASRQSTNWQASKKRHDVLPDCISFFPDVSLSLYCSYTLCHNYKQHFLGLPPYSLLFLSSGYQSLLVPHPPNSRTNSKKKLEPSRPKEEVLETTGNWVSPNLT